MNSSSNQDTTQAMDDPGFGLFDFTAFRGGSLSGSRPGTSGSRGSLNGLLASIGNSNQTETNTSGQDQNLFSMPDDFSGTDQNGMPISDGNIDPALFYPDSMDLQMQPAQQQYDYPDPTNFGPLQGIDGPKNLPQPYGIMTYNEQAPEQVLGASHGFRPSSSFTQHFGQTSHMLPQYQNTDEYAPHDSQDMEYRLVEEDEEDESESSPEPNNKRRKTTEAVAKASKKYRPEAPKKDFNKSWVRNNHSTKGNSRTGKTQKFGNGDYAETTPHPLNADSWTSNASGKFNRFEYNAWGELHGVCFPASKLNDFLFSHPFNHPTNPGPAKLTLWIQKMPGDSARRVETLHGLKCRVKECPAGIYKHRTINTGHYRVAFDEQWEVHGDNRNPMHVAGYAHLYCLERFFDFRRICAELDVRADDREIEREPTGEWVAGLGPRSEEFHVANSFIKFCKQGKNQKTWSQYPPHDSSHPNRRKPHAATLSYKMTEAKVHVTGASKMRMMEKRDRSATQFFVNMGDLQVQIDAQQEKAALKKGGVVGQTPKRKRAKQVYDSDDEEADDDDAEIYAQPRPAPIANMGRRNTRSSARLGTAQQMQDVQGFNNAQGGGLIMEDFMPAPLQTEQPANNGFSFDFNAPAPSSPVDAQRAADRDSLFDEDDDMQISPRTIPAGMIDPALADGEVR